MAGDTPQGNTHKAPVLERGFEGVTGWVVTRSDHGYDDPRPRGEEASDGANADLSLVLGSARRPAVLPPPASRTSCSAHRTG